MEFRDLLRLSGLVPESCSVMLHTPIERRLRYNLPRIIGTQPALFEAFQSCHGQRAGHSLAKRALTASFVARGDGGLVFAGIFQVANARQVIDADQHTPERVALAVLAGEPLRWTDDAMAFDLTLTDHLADLRGRLVIRPRLTPNYVRRAENLDAPVCEISEVAIWDAPPPPRRELVISGAELRTIGPWQMAKLKEWRGIYLILDPSDGERYIGSAYGEVNIYARCQAHVRGDSGITVGLRDRDPARFLFSVLELTSPALPADEVIALEHTWMKRLHTRDFGLNT